MVVDLRVIQKFHDEERPVLGITEDIFLKLFTIENYSAYGLWKTYSKVVKPMSYKNVHKRIKRLEELKLIEYSINEGVRNAKMYKITDFGKARLRFIDREMELRRKHNIE